ncbi:MAG: metal-sensing transcriptional repressor [Pseudomonadota bacterium]|jgi:DNA-binding FrmR family transcriptional regulator|nr:metal-sensing transcriptional repressor [Pseudomonadota bacterium]
MSAEAKVKAPTKAAAPAAGDEACKPTVLTDSDSRTEILNRLRRAEGQLRGIQRMIEDGEPCLKIGQQFSAVRKALDSTYLRMTVCFMEQELEQRLAPGEEQKADLSAMMKDMETLLARMS